MKLLQYLGCFFFLSGCLNKETNCPLTISKLNRVSGNRVFGTHLLRGTIDEFRDKGSDSIMGGYYVFYPNKNLKSYEYFINKSEFIYKEEYNSSGDLVNVKGNPVVRSIAELINDSLSFKVYFFSLNKTYKKINVKTSDNRDLNLTLYDDTLYSNVKVASFYYNKLREETDLISSFNIEFQNQCNNKISSFSDTVVIHFNPKIQSVRDLHLERPSL